MNSLNLQLEQGNAHIIARTKTNKASRQHPFSTMCIGATPVQSLPDIDTAISKDHVWILNTILPTKSPRGITSEKSYFSLCLNNIKAKWYHFTKSQWLA